jgi:hypothetical protein
MGPNRMFDQITCLGHDWILDLASQSWAWVMRLVRTRSGSSAQHSAGRFPQLDKGRALDLALLPGHMAGRWSLARCSMSSAGC